MKSNKLLSYSEMIKLKTFEERLKYLQQQSFVGEDTFGSRRWLNQRFYNSYFWHKARNSVILRDSGCDLGISDRPILGRVYIHHLNPITADDILQESLSLTDLENLVCVSMDTHNLIHYGREETVKPEQMERTQWDTCPWKGR